MHILSRTLVDKGVMCKHRAVCHDGCNITRYTYSRGWSCNRRKRLSESFQWKLKQEMRCDPRGLAYEGWSMEVDTWVWTHEVWRMRVDTRNTPVRGVASTSSYVDNCTNAHATRRSSSTSNLWIIYTYIYMYKNICLYTYIYILLHICIYIYIHTYVYIYTCIEDQY